MNTTVGRTSRPVQGAGSGEETVEEGERTGGDRTDVAELLSLLDDEYARAILREGCDEAVSAVDLADRIGASLPTVYRRVERLDACGLLRRRTALDPGGSHYQVYRTRSLRLEVCLDGDGITATVSKG